MNRFSLFIVAAGACLAAAPSMAQQASPNQLQGPDKGTAEAAPAEPGAKPAPARRKDRRVGKLHDQLRGQKNADDKDLNEATPSDPYAGYLHFKKELESATGVTYQLQPGVMWQWGAPNGGSNAAQFLWTPSLNWDMFDNDRVGQGSIQIGYTYNNYWTRPTGVTLSNRLNVLSQINDSAANTYNFSTLTYTHVFPGNLLQVTVGQYGFGNFDSNQYAGNQLTNFVNYALSQHGSQAYTPDRLGGYVQINPTDTIAIAGGGQNAENITGDYIQANGVFNAPWAWFVYGQWTPTLPFLPASQSSQYSLVVYDQPSVPQQPVSSIGWSANAVQNINANWGLFARANHSTGPISPIATSIAGGVAYNNPFNFGKKDQIGVGLAWNATNMSAYAGQAVRSSETVAEAYYNHVFFKVLQVGPDVQVIFNPALYPHAGTAEVFTFRITGLI